MQIDEKLLAVRKKLGLSKAQMADGVIDPSYYSRVERGESNISATDLIGLLQKHNVSVIDFLSEFGDIQPKIEVYQRQALKAFNNKDLEKLEEIKNDPQLNYVILKKIAEGILDYLTTGKKVEISSDLKSYLSNVDHWSDYDLWNLWVCLQVYLPTYLQSLAEMAVAQFLKHDYEKENYISLELAAKIAMTNLKLAYSSGEDGLVRKMIDLLDKFPAVNSTYFPKMVGKYYEAAYNQDKLMKAKIEDALEVMKGLK